jgi:phospholipid/cholesterol/gamma-HCH transport system ATP-binding protein
MTGTVDETQLSDDELLDSEGPVVEVRGLRSSFGDNIVHDGLDLIV